MELIKYPTRMLTKWGQCSSGLRRATSTKHGRKAEGQKSKAGKERKKARRKC
jgi:hypothetical protein